MGHFIALYAFINNPEKTLKDEAFQNYMKTKRSPEETSAGSKKVR